jgi:hypothetical protein
MGRRCCPQLLVAIVREDGVRYPGVALATCARDVPGSLEAVEQARDSGRRQQNALGEVDTAEAPVRRVGEAKQDLVVVQSQAVRCDQLRAELPR